MSDEAASLEVLFAANIDQLTSASTAVDDIFASVADAAASSASDITSSMTAAADSLTSISEAGSQIGVGVEEGAASATNALASIPAEAEEAASQSESAFSGFNVGGMVSGIGMGIFSLQAIGNIATQTAGALLGPAEAAENTEASFTNLLGSSKAASDELGKLNTFASQTQFKTQDIDNAAASLIAFKTPAQNVVPELTAVGDALTAVGKGTPAEMQGVVNILGKIGVQGHLTAGDITQLGAHGIDAMSAIEKGSGLSKTALEQMISSGTLPANKAIDDLTKGIEKNPVYSGGMAKQAGTLSGQMSTLGSDFDQVMAAALKPALPQLETTLGKLTTILTSPSFKQFAVTMGKDIATGITDVVNGVTNLVNTGKNLVDFFTHNQTAMDALEAGLAGIGAVILAVVIPAMVAWAIAMAPVALEAIIVAAPFILLGLVVGAVIFGIIEAVQHWSQIQAFVGNAVKVSMGAVGSFFGSVGHDIQNIFGNIGQAAQNVGKGIEGAFKGGVNGVIQGLNWLINAVDSFHISVPPLVVAGVTVFGGVDLGLPYIPDIPLLARGGVVPPGQVAIAGEAGAELVYGGTSGASVMSASQTAAMMNNNSGGGDTVIQIYMDGQEITNKVMTKVVKRIRQQGGKVVGL